MVMPTSFVVAFVQCFLLVSFSQRSIMPLDQRKLCSSRLSIVFGFFSFLLLGVIIAFTEYR